MKKGNFLLKTDLDKKTEDLTNEEIGKLIRKIFKYVKGEALPILSEKLEMIFKFIKVDIDENEKKYEEICKKRKESGSKGGAPKGNQNARKQPKQPKTTKTSKTTKNNMTYHNHTHNQEIMNDYLSSNEDKKESKPKKKFIKPTLKEVEAYCFERKNKVDPQKFVDYYESNGWMVGKNHMKDWKASIRTWERNDGSFSNKRGQALVEKNLPNWFDKQNEKLETTEEEKKELGEILQELGDNDENFAEEKTEE